MDADRSPVRTGSSGTIRSIRSRNPLTAAPRLRRDPDRWGTIALHRRVVAGALSRFGHLKEIAPFDNTGGRRYFLCVIPEFEPGTGNLPPGIFLASWDEIMSRFGYTPIRREILDGLRIASESLRRAGCVWLYLNGSFVTSVDDPEDFDACWEETGVDIELLNRIEPTLLLWSDRRFAQKVRFHGELFIADVVADRRGTSYLEFFPRDKQTGQPKGIVALNLAELP